VVAELESQILAVLDERERDQLRDLLSRIVEAAGAEDGLEADAA
jgi:DNA-binding MarR family transcriptional regulator